MAFDEMIIPGLFDSGPDHWQSHWLRSRPQALKVDLGAWDSPRPWATATSKGSPSSRGTLIGVGAFARAPRARRPRPRACSARWSRGARGRALATPTPRRRRRAEAPWPPSA